MNIPEGGVVPFVGAAWTNEPPAEMSPPVAQSDGTWVFVVNGTFRDGSASDGYRVTVRNTRTNSVASDVVRAGYFAVAFTDLTRRSVVETGDVL